MLSLANTRIVVTGGSGFLGSHVVEELERRGCRKVGVFRSAEYDLTRPEAIARMYARFQPQLVIHLAAVVGGIGANRDKPGQFFHDNLVIGVHLMEQARLHAVEKFVCVGTVCAYPKFTPVPFREEDLWNGYPEETNAPYGLAKKMLLVQAQAYRQQYGFNAIYLLPVNLYGPRDSFDPARSHVIPALIKKCVDAIGRGLRTIEVWGTGEASREFLYVADCAKAIVAAAANYDGPEPLNLGTGQEIKIRELLEIIVSLTGYRGEIAWDYSKPDGQPRRCVDVSRARRELNFSSETDFVTGLKRTIEWYRRARRTGLAS
jgi:GDP-L-fucose synthase